jgi:hypothetical protein
MVVAVGRGKAHEREHPLGAGGQGARVGLGSGGRQPSARVAEHDDVAPLEVDDIGHELVHEDAVIDLQRVLHRP